jgi:hypothetical protein
VRSFWHIVNQATEEARLRHRLHVSGLFVDDVVSVFVLYIMCSFGIQRLVL